LYHIKHSKSKESLWFCYGDIIVENLKRNIGNKTNVCQYCGKRFEKEYPNQEYCKEHRGYQKIESKTITCIDCGKEVKVDALDNQTNRCNECYNKYRKKIINENAKRYYYNKKSK
jgi:DNA-directed RNA polymerase subunit RPC12/RpoP